MRYLFAVGEDENGPVMLGDTGNPVVAYTLDQAGDIAREVLKSGQIPADAGVFVLKLAPVAFYLPIPPAKDVDGEVFVDETIVFKEREKPNGN